MRIIMDVLKNINHLIWGMPMLLLLMGTHLFFTFKLKFIQKKTLKAILLSVTPEKDTDKGLSSFAALATTLAATLGTGNIIGVSTAVALGGPGAVFWCWLTGFLGMATTYGECYLSCLFRRKSPDGTYLGGPMYYLEDGLHSKFLAVLFAVFTLIASYGVGCSTQSNSMAVTAFSMWGVSPYITGFAAAILTGLVIIGGIKKLGNVCVKLVPAMGIFYIGGCITILIINHDFLLSAFQVIFKSAFAPYAIAGGFIGGSLQSAMRYGIARGLFTNEAGLGSAGIAAASSRSQDPKRQALVSMTATFWDTVVMCAITGVVIVSNLLKNPSSIQGLNSAELTTAAFLQIPYVGRTMLGISLMAFAMATLMGWSFFGERAVQYLFGTKGIDIYRVGYLVMIFLGAIMSLDLVWELCDLVNAFMAIPNLIGILCLHKLIKAPHI